MTTAQQNTQNQLSELWESKGAFFAFSNQQLAEKAKKDVKYVSLFAGLICPEENAKSLLEEMEKITEELVWKVFHKNAHKYDF